MTDFLIQGHFAGGDAGQSVRSIVVSLRKSLSALNAVTYSDDIKSFRFRLGVSGEIDAFKEDSGCGNFRVMKKSGYASADITMQKDVWTKGASTVRLFLSKNIYSGTQELCARIEKAGLKINTSSLLSDLDLLLNDWVATEHS